MNGNDRDVFVYDRCGRITYFIEGTQSLLSHHHHIASAIFNTFYHQPCGYCQHDPRHKLREQGHVVSEASDEFTCKERSPTGTRARFLRSARLLESLHQSATPQWRLQKTVTRSAADSTADSCHNHWTTVRLLCLVRTAQNSLFFSHSTTPANDTLRRGLSISAGGDKPANVPTS